LQQSQASLAAADVRVAVVGFASASRLEAYRSEHRIPFVCLADPAREVYRAYGLARGTLGAVFHPKTLGRYLDLLRHGWRPALPADDPMQMGGDFLVGRDGRLLLAHYSRHPADRPSVATILAASGAAGADAEPRPPRPGG